MTRARIAAAVTGIVALSALIAACGGGDRDPAPTATGATSTATRAASPTAVSTQIGQAATPTAPTVEATPTAGAANTPAPQPTQPQPAPTQPQMQPPPPPPTQPLAAIALTVVAKSLRFSPTRLAAPAGATLSVTLDNKDADTPHDIVFDDPSGTQIAATEIFNGPASQTVTFSVGGAGSYDYQCSVHPFQMTGTLTVQ